MLMCSFKRVDAKPLRASRYQILFLLSLGRVWQLSFPYSCACGCGRRGTLTELPRSLAAMKHAAAPVGPSKASGHEYQIPASEGFREGPVVVGSDVVEAAAGVGMGVLSAG